MGEGEHSHLVYVDRNRGMLRIGRIYPNGARVLYTETRVPSTLEPSEISRFLRELGENIALDSPVLRKALFSGSPSSD